MSAGFVQQYKERLEGAFSTWGPVLTGAPWWWDRELEAPLEEMYAPPRAVEARGGELLLDAAAVVRRARPVVVCGPVGAGKGLWLRWLFRRLLARRDAFPLWIDLRELARRWREERPQGAARSLDHYLAERVEEHLGPGWRGALEAALRAPGGDHPLLLMDGTSWARWVRSCARSCWGSCVPGPGSRWW
jgi:hypothetical protein